MPNINAGVTALLLSALTLWGCGAATENDPPPSVTIDEMRMFGITISLTGDFPKSVPASHVEGTRGNGDYIDLSDARLQLYFAADPDHVIDVVQSGGNVLRASEAYEYTFSTADGAGGFPEIAPAIGNFDPDAPRDRYYSTVLPNCIKELRFSERFCLSGPLLIIPVEATHVDFWYRETPESERELLHRAALANLSAWRLYVEPLIAATPPDTARRDAPRVALAARAGSHQPDGRLHDGVVEAAAESLPDAPRDRRHAERGVVARTRDRSGRRSPRSGARGADRPA